jgi:hypothetical protein
MVMLKLEIYGFSLTAVQWNAKLKGGSSVFIGTEALYLVLSWILIVMWPSDISSMFAQCELRSREIGRRHYTSN